MSEAVLHPESGLFTKALADTLDTHGRFAGLIGGIKNIGVSVTPDDWVPWLVWDYGLEEVVPYVRDLRRALAEGPAWQARRGTDDGIAIGIGWVEVEGAVEPGDQRHDWWEFQVALDQVVTDTLQLRQLEGIIKLSKASEDELFRMYHGRDHRPVRMDMHRTDMGGLYDAYSGASLWDGGPLISFGWLADPELELSPLLSGLLEVADTDLLLTFESIRMDRNRCGERPNEPTFGPLELEFVSALDGDKADAWPSFWPIDPATFRGDHEPIPTDLEIT